MDKDEKRIKKEKQEKKEQAINESATQGERVNHQEQSRQEKHQPRDTA